MRDHTTSGRAPDDGSDPSLRSPSPRIPLRRKVVYLVIPWLLFVALLELGARLVSDAPHGSSLPFDQLGMCLPDPARVWRYKARHRAKIASDEFETTVETNSWGLRDREIQIDDDAIRVLVIGNSFSFGWGVEADERFSEVLERALRRSGRNVQILNGAHWGYTFDQQYLAARELVRDFRPQIVVQGVYPGHVVTIDEHEWARGADGKIDRVVFREWRNEIRVGTDGRLHRTNALIERPPLGSRLISMSAQRIFRWRQTRSEVSLEIELYRDGTRLDGAWRKSTEALQQASRFLREQGMIHFVFSVPQDVSLSESEWPEYFRAGAAGGELDQGRPYARFAEAAREAVWMDLHPGFARAFRSDLYFPKDIHWTPAGHALAAELLRPCLEQLVDAAAAGLSATNALERVSCDPD